MLNQGASIRHLLERVREANERVRCLLGKALEEEEVRHRAFVFHNEGQGFLDARLHHGDKAKLFQRLQGGLGSAP